MTVTNLSGRPSGVDTPAGRWRSPWPWFAAGVVAGWVWLLVGHRHHGATWAGACGMWLLMSAVMMAPTAVPVLASLRSVLGGRSTSSWWSFLGGYLTVWAGVAVIAASVQVVLIRVGVLGHDGSAARRWVAVVVLGIAGAYQLSAFKARCLHQCVNPMSFFWRHWRDGVTGAARMGLRHGLTCLGCCWALMSLAFVGGVASVWFMALGTLLMLFEKLPALGGRLAVPIGIALICAAALLAVLPGAPVPDHHHPGAGSVGVGVTWKEVR